MKAQLIFICALSLPLFVHATPAQLIDTEADEIGAAIELTGDAQPYEMSDDDTDLGYDVASLKATGGGCTTLSGVASVYGLNHGSGDGAHQALAGGGHLNTGALTAAMLKIPLGKRVRVTARNGKSVTVLVNDKGPYVRGRIIDLTPAAAHALGFSGTEGVTVTTCGS
jgi:rare lipoprotein A